MVKINKRILACIICAGIQHLTLQSVTEVYNLRVSTITAERINLGEKFAGKKRPGSFSSKLVTRTRTTNDGHGQLLVADVSTIIYSFGNFYARADGAFGYVREKSSIEPSTKHVQTDDLLLSLGYNHKVHPKLDLTYTILGGIPTHKDYAFQFYQFGTGHYAIAGQIAAVLKNGSHAWVSALRYINFFKAKAFVPLETTCLPVDFAFGRVADFIIAFYQTIRTAHSLEMGYNPVFSHNVATKPVLDPPIFSYGIRNSWYTIYRYAFEKGSHPMGIGFSASYGFDITPKIDGALRRNMCFWLSYNIKF